MNLPPFPNHLARTGREWKQRKRTEFRKVRQALEAFRLGCAYTPDHEAIEHLFDAANQIEQQISEKNWGR